MARLSKQQVIKTPLKTEEVDVPEWGGSVLVSEIPVAKRNELFGRYIDENGKPVMSMQLYLDMFVAGCVEPAFTMEEASGFSHKPVELVAKAALKLNGLGGDGGDEARGNS